MASHGEVRSHNRRAGPRNAVVHEYFRYDIELVIDSVDDKVGLGAKVLVGVEAPKLRRGRCVDRTERAPSSSTIAA